MVKWHIGTMGFNYKEWIGPFYPAGLPARQHLSYYSERLNALEMDSTFYGIPSEKAVKRWASVTSADFIICPKMPSVITHEKRLIDAAEETTEFLDRMRLLGKKLGPILLQFPPDFSIVSIGAFVKFLPLLSQDLRFAIEFRHRSWDTAETTILLQNHHLCLVAADYMYMPHEVTATTDFLYLRFLGPRGRFPNKDREMIDRSADLEKWRQRIQPYTNAMESVFSFFNDDFAGFAPVACNRFKKVLGFEPGEIRPLQQGRLF